MNFFHHLIHRANRGLLCGAAALSLCATAPHARAATSLALSSPAAVTVVPGGSFSFTLLLSSTDASLNGLDYNLTASSAGLFAITGRSLTGSAFSDPITADNLLFLGGAPLALNPSEPYDLGATGNTRTAPFNGLFVATYTVRTAGSATSGSYRLMTSGERASDDQFNTVALGGVILNVNVVPEPGTAWLLLVLAGTTAVITRRRLASGR